ncbi:hypothetical protein PDJ82_25285 [Bacillus cereus group sp. TH43LC]|uniref:Uncharacterized protein n=1 Tax=Bacillus phage IEBH TaxID=2884422 RepID=B5LPN2_9CAUD|nr:MULTISPECIES: hypothetical protein [Bacteria]YP_002154346.1 hypothetical protein IEBH_gp21 [Bacillus phage IEBH]EJR02009.1 hypothetical protein II7_05812 [Bacillus cereus MSX-A12]KLA17804.1 hypothetical protein B4078_5462 [Bacillus cereus]MCH6799156.1 hypothetical protein [Escherichia coli]ACH42278.1 hypothetical protein [Bacillus phage IEBH]KXI81090.1 hypothetical protein ACS54_08985 [Bacillus cereus]
MKAEHIELYEQALSHEQGQASKWFCEVNNLEAQLQIAKSHYKHHTEERDRLQNLVTRWKGQTNGNGNRI